MQAIGTVAAAIVAFAIMMVFPDNMGGGWTQFRRFEVFPYFFILLAMAFEGFTAKVMAVVTTASVVLVFSMVDRQTMIREQMEPLAQVDKLVGAHCTVLPLAIEIRPRVYEELAWMDCQPFFQSASRLEQHGNRVVLFNYLARLSPYPVHFKPEIERQSQIFHWTPAQPEAAIDRVDIDRFEATSGMRVDYILVWGRPWRKKQEVQRQVAYAISRFDPLYRSANGMVALYRRQGIHNESCDVNGPVKQGLDQVHEE